MEFQSAYLLVRRLRSYGSGQATSASIKQFSIPEDGRYVQRYSPSGFCIGSTLYNTAPIKIEKRKLGAVSVALHSVLATDTGSTSYIVPIEEFSLKDYVKQSPSDANAWRAEICAALFPGQEFNFDRDFSTILYLEPVERITSDIASRLGQEGAIRALRSAFNQSDSAAIPQIYSDLFFCHGSGTIGRKWELVLVRHAPFTTRYTEGYCIPVSLFEIDTALSLIHRLESALEAINQNPQYWQDPSSYVVKVLGASPAAGLNWLIGAKALRGYHEHMRNRLQTICSGDSARALAASYRTIRDKFDANASIADDDWVWMTETFSAHPMRYGEVFSFRRDLRDAGEAIEETAVELDLRDRAISEYFTDYVNAAVARSNMILQRTVLFLSILTVVVSAIALLKP